MSADQPDIAGWRKRFDAVEPKIRAFVEEPDRWGRLAKHPQRNGPLSGVMLGVKDVIRYAPLPTRSGATLPSELFAGPEASCVTRLVNAGAIVLGKTETTEFAYFEPGPTRNPKNIDHTPGGSSSGSAAAVAAGLCDLALGTQTVGSINRPAAYCGVVGFKPTYGRVPTDGLIHFSPSVDTIGTFAPSVDMTHRAAAVMLDHWRGDLSPNSQPRLAIPEGPLLAHVDPPPMASFRATCERLREAGIDVRSMDTMPDFEAIAERHRDLVAAEMAAVHRTWFAQYADRYRPRTRAIIERGQAVTPEKLAECVDSIESLQRHLHEIMDREGIDAWIAPAAPGTAPRGLEVTGDPIMNLPWTHARMPSLSLPSDILEDNLPLGVQLVGRLHEDELLLQHARTLEPLIILS